MAGSMFDLLDPTPSGNTVPNTMSVEASHQVEPIVTNLKFDVLILNRLHVEPNSWNGLNDLANLQSVKNSGFPPTLSSKQWRKEVSRSKSRKEARGLERGRVEQKKTLR